jgi:pimeloyl-ACP methyl ester carboxylesterase
LNHDDIQTDRIKLHVVSDGPSTGPLVILLHGFPEFWYGWRSQISYLAAAGYHVWIPDQRGYNLSDKPEAIAAYSIDELAADVVGLMDAAGHDKALIVGHDWGAAVAWHVAETYPHRVERLVIINVPHPAVMKAQLRQNIAQLFKSWYIFFFQLPWVPEAIAQFNNWALPTQALETTSRPGTFTATDLDQYRQAWAQPNAYSSMVNWYRANFHLSSAPPTHPRITVPTLMIWGTEDQFLGRELAQPSIDCCDEGRLVFIEGATHWVHHEEADRVNTLIEEFFKASR